MDPISYSDFEKIEIRTGTVLRAEFLEKARKPAIKMEIDFGAAGVRKSSAQITDHYKPEDLPGKQVLAVLNFPPKQIGGFMSECLVLGAVNSRGEVILIGPDQPIENGLIIR